MSRSPQPIRATPPPVMRRVPSFPTSEPENGDTRTKTRAIGIRAIPTPTGSSVPALCHVKGSRNSTPYIPKVIPAVAATVPRNSRTLNKSKGIRAPAPRFASTLMNKARVRTATPRASPATAVEPWTRWRLQRGRRAPARQGSERAHRSDAPADRTIPESRAAQGSGPQSRAAPPEGKYYANLN